MLYVATERRRLARRSAWLLFCAGRLLGLPRLRPRAEPGRHLARPVRPDGAAGSPTSSSSGLFGHGLGGLLGTGLGRGHPRRITYVAESDFIVAAFGEELGLTGLIAIILLYAPDRRARPAHRARRAATASASCSPPAWPSSFALQVFVVVGGVTRLIPLTGLTTPFLSYGGSSLVANWALVALLLRISDQARRPAARGERRRAPSTDEPHPGGEAAMNKPIRTALAGRRCCCSLALLVNDDATSSTSSRPTPQRATPTTADPARRAFSRERGAILVGQHAGRERVPSDDEYKYQRVYPHGALYAHVTGYFSYLRPDRHRAGQNDAAVRRRRPALRTAGCRPGHRHAEPQGASVQLTLDPEAQTAAVRRASGGTAGRRGGARPAAPARSWRWSPPDATTRTSSPATTSTRSTRPTNAAQRRPRRAAAQPGDPDELYPPGSTFKLVTAAAALSSAASTPTNTMVPGPAVLDLPADHRRPAERQRRRTAASTERSRSTQALADLLQHGLRLRSGSSSARTRCAAGREVRLRRRARGADPGPRRAAFPADLNEPQTGAVGDRPVRRPGHPAADGDGRGRRSPTTACVMKPYLVDDGASRPTSTVARQDRARRSSPGGDARRSPHELTQMMVPSSRTAPARRAQIPGVEVAGKTGTAQTATGRKPPYAWFISFAPADDPKVAVAVHRRGRRCRGHVRPAAAPLAAPIAKPMMEAVEPMRRAQHALRARRCSAAATSSASCSAAAAWPRCARATTPGSAARSRSSGCAPTSPATRPSRPGSAARRSRRPSLNHPAIVAVYDTGEETATDGTGVAQPYIVMEYVAGRTLRDILREGRKILPERALEITVGVLAALDYSHRAGIIHRDIKPGNVMLTPSGDVKVMDFGIARAIADASSTMTQTAAVVGTAQYLSPEQARGETVDSRSDVYSTGCLLYELLTGRPPFVGDSPVAVAYQHVREQPPPPSELDDRTLPPDDRRDRDEGAGQARRGPLPERRRDARRHAGGAARPPISDAARAPRPPSGAAAVAAATEAGPPRRRPDPERAAAPPRGPVDRAPVRTDEPEEEQARPRRHGSSSPARLAIVAVAALAYALSTYLDTEQTPKVRGPARRRRPGQTATGKLAQVKLVADPVRQPSDTVPEDTSSARTPADTEVAPNSTVASSCRPARTAVDRSRLMGLTEREAQSQLSEPGLEVGTDTEVDDPDTDAGKVHRLEPGAEHP